jgi:DNA-binding response OmpR family regulator
MSPGLNIEIISRSELPSGRSIPSVEQPRRPVVLVVDDEHVIADTLSIIFKQSGFSALTAYDGESALELTTLVPPQLLLSDVMLGPGINGAELAIEITKTCPDCKVLLFSGHAATRDLLDSVGAAGNNFTLLNKPLHPSDLLARINESFPTARPVMTT